jgi:hypothetical protein
MTTSSWNDFLRLTVRPTRRLYVASTEEIVPVSWILIGGAIFTALVLLSMAVALLVGPRE